VTSKVGALAAFTQRREVCLGCKTPLPANADGGALCQHCRPREPAFLQVELAKMNELETGFCRLWTQCQRCQGSLHEEVICTRSVTTIKSLLLEQKEISKNTF
jgi:DNA polymerase delta subunit 1